MVLAGQVGLIGGIYSLEDGQVTFFEDTWMCREVKHFFIDVDGSRPRLVAHDLPRG
jgi:hypothetical protein